MGHSKLNLALVVAGFFTLGAVFGHADEADAAAVILDPVLILAEPLSACTEYTLDDELTAYCEDDGQMYDVEHFAVSEDTDYPGEYYLTVWE
jgi:hypothetical protein